MQKWIKQNLTIMTLLTLISAAAICIARGAVLDSDVQKLNIEVFGKNRDGDDLAGRLGRLEANTKDIQDSVHRIEGYTKR